MQQPKGSSGFVLMVVVIYLAAFVAANLFVKHFGSYGLWFSAMFLIPFDFICRCLFHEKWKGSALIIRLLILTVLSSVITVAINSDAANIAKASCAGFISAQICAGIFYQYFIKQTPFVKVNGSDLLAIISDSIVFQYIAFGGFNWQVTAGQIIIKFVGGLLWYYIIFNKLKLHEKINRS